MPLLRLLLLAALLLGALPRQGAAVSLTVDEAVLGAIRGNLSLKVQTFNPAISVTDIRRARAIYNPAVTALFDHVGSNTQTVPDSASVDRLRSFDANLSASRLLSTGATATASMTNLWQQDNLGTASSRFAKPTLSLSLSQPLLQGLGREVTERSITVAEFANGESLATWWTTALSVAADTRNQYYTLVKARENLDTSRTSLALAKEIHSGNEARVKAGVLAAIELLDSQSGVAQRELDLLTAETASVLEAEKLLVFLHMPPKTEILPVEPFPKEPLDASEDNALRTAMSMRPDLRNARTALRSSEFTARVSKNLALPSLALTGSAGLTGLDSDYGGAIDDLKSGQYPTWSVGLQFSYPIGNDAAEADLAKNRLLAAQAKASLENLEEAAVLDVRTSILQLETGWKKIEVAAKGVEFQEARLDSYIKRGKLGLATTKDILQVESDLTTARVNLAGARADYQVAVTSFWKSTGELLERHGIRIEDKEIESRAWKEIR